MIITEFFPKDMFKGRVVFVTGGGSGICLGIAKNFAAVGADVAICGRTKAKLESAAEEIKAFGARVYTHACDVRDYGALEAALNGAQEHLGPIHTLVCGAAGNFPCPAEALSPNGFKAVIDIDLLGSFNAARAAFPQLQETRGNLIFISAGQAFLPYLLQCHVGAAKAGIDNLMKNLALEWGKYGIRSNSIAPGPIEGTEGVERLLPGAAATTAHKHIPLGRFGTVDEIGQTAVFLASPLASYITGTVLVCDGGQNLPGSGVTTQAILEAMG